MAGHHPVQLLALLQFLGIKAAQNSVDLGVYGGVDGYLKVEDGQDGTLGLHDLVLVDEPLAFSDHLGDLGRVDLVHLAGEEEAGECNFLVVVLVDGQVGRGEAVEEGDGEVLGVLVDLLVEGEDPLDGEASVLVVDGLDGVGRGVGRLREGRHRGALVQQPG